MKITFDMDSGEIIRSENGAETGRFSMASPQGFELAAKAWVRCGWDAKYVYTFSWFGRPVIQLPDDMVRIQEVLYALKPDVIIETGVAHGGSLIFYASICKAMEKGRVVGIDIEIRPHNRKAIESHELFPFITLIEGGSTEERVLGKVRKLVQPGETVLVLLDSNHTYDHVLAELEAYSPFVTKGSYIVATDGVMKDLKGAPRSQGDWPKNNPYEAARAFTDKDGNYRIEEPVWPFNESTGLKSHVATYWPGAWIKRCS